MIPPLDTLRLLASLFTRPTFAALARTDDCRAVLGPLLKAGIVRKQTGFQTPLSAVFEEASTYLSKYYRNEYIYKNDLASRIIFGRHSPRTAGFQVELPIGRSIIDVAVANGTTTAYEIKTEFDSAKRLKSQTVDYLKVFDRVFVVTHPAHVARFESELDCRVGLILLGATGKMTTYRDAQSNRGNIIPAAVFRCLRQTEYLSAINDLFGAVPQLSNGLIGSHCESLFATIPAGIAHEIFVKSLRARTTDGNTVQFIASLPPSLRALGYATPLSGRQRNDVLSLLKSDSGFSIAL